MLLAAGERRPHSTERSSMSEPRQYELIYVIAPDVDDAGVAELHARVEEIVTAGGGTIDKTDNWGRRRLAYEINRHKEGTY
ncbi:MAG: 30S ribosomal protein S6, partial [Acidobacteria bacterium]|nr:30S ribosomal protein S6 [Acidobacteriota bacterium]